MICRVLALSLVLVFVACTGGDGTAPGSNGKRLQPWAANPDYYAWDGSEPVLLAGAGVNVFLRDDADRLINEIQAAGGNLLTVVLRPGQERPQPFHRDPATERYDLKHPNPAYWAGLTELLNAARAGNMAVHLNGYGGQHYLAAPDQAFQQVFNQRVVATVEPFKDIVIYGSSPYRKPRYGIDAEAFPSLRTPTARFNALALSGEGLIEYARRPRPPVFV